MADSCSRSLLRAYALYTVLFVLGIYSNMRSLAASNVDTVIVFRAAVPLAVAAGDFVWLGRAAPSARSLAAMVVVLAGCAAFVAVDAEFAVQYLVLAQARHHPELVPNVGNIALLQRAEAAGLLPVGVGQAAADAYRNLRRAQHEARLNERPTQVPQAQLAADPAAVLALWRAVFDGPAGSAAPTST